MGWGGHSPVSDGHDPGWDSELASLSEGTCPFGSSCWSAVSRLQANLMLKSSHDELCNAWVRVLPECAGYCSNGITGPSAHYLPLFHEVEEVAEFAAID